jgi:hypothetical protein
MGREGGIGILLSITTSRTALVRELLCCKSRSFGKIETDGEAWLLDDPHKTKECGNVRRIRRRKLFPWM